MSLSVAIQMDPIDTINIEADSTFVLALEAQARGHRLWHYGPRDLSFRDGRVMARARPLTVRRVAGDHFTLGPDEGLDLSTVDVVLMRQDPPFDMSYITATHLLDHIHPDTLVVNTPSEVRNAPEKLFVCRWPELMPPTLISADVDAIKAFREDHKDIIVKPLFGNGGAGVFHLKPGDENLGALLEMFGSISREPLMVQRYLPEIREGDKRIILVDGEAMGAINRIPADGEARSNMHVGGRPVVTDLSPRDREICAAIGPELRDRGLIFVGIDVIGGYLTEINVTSPTGLQEVARLGGPRLEGPLWDAIERRWTATRVTAGSGAATG
ncbi:glutathione synthase [Roseospira marina]|uniref:Glutathione synthetase n=1 Tax=Roseospira marina TaxID=140057 RepID=A0A5M6IJ63_9PROT|nr:glutathione synthase [Roseospira marina]KAA5607658.1 glutathione synthase [Roseospira marina]MBB4312140.1 glutathione synthase [Roseospira marina]MBB5085844.1 glutathione synthase [Roseospira marina]